MCLLINSFPYFEKWFRHIGNLCTSFIYFWVYGMCIWTVYVWGVLVLTMGIFPWLMSTFYLVCNCECAHVWCVNTCTYVWAWGTHGVWKRTLGHLELGSQTVVSCPLQYWKLILDFHNCWCVYPSFCLTGWLVSKLPRSVYHWTH